MITEKTISEKCYNENMGTVFFHIDLDAFFAAVEILDNPEYKDKPLIIGTPGKRSVASTCSYKAREYGVHSAMPMVTALKLCPNAICIPPRMHRYSEKSKEVMSIIKSFAPGFLQVSIDEAFLDLTGMERIYPLPGKAAGLLKTMIYEQTGLTVSIGVASSRFVAKLASDFKKPNGLTIVPPGREIELVDRIGLKKLWGIGKSTYEALVKKGLNTPEIIRGYSERELESIVGQSGGRYLYSVSRGIDPGIYQGEAKSHSISTEITFYNDVYGEEALSEYILAMSHELMFKAMDEKTIPRTVGIKLRYGDFTTTTIQETPLMPIYSAADVYEIAKKLLHKRYSGEGIRLLGLFLSQLYEGEEVEQRDLFDESQEKRRNLEKAILELKKKGNVLQKARLLKTQRPEQEE